MSEGGASAQARARALGRGTGDNLPRVADVDNVESEESEEEWNYFRVEPTVDKSSVPQNLEDCAAQDDDDDMESQLNPNAAVFVPLSPTEASNHIEQPFNEDLTQEEFFNKGDVMSSSFIARDPPPAAEAAEPPAQLLNGTSVEEVCLAGSPAKGAGVSMNGIVAPTEAEFCSEARSRPGDLDRQSPENLAGEDSEVPQLSSDNPFEAVISKSPECDALPASEAEEALRAVSSSPTVDAVTDCLADVTVVEKTSNDSQDVEESNYVTVTDESNLLEALSLGLDAGMICSPNTDLLADLENPVSPNIDVGSQLPDSNGQFDAPVAQSTPLDIKGDPFCFDFEQSGSSYVTVKDNSMNSESHMSQHNFTDSLDRPTDSVIPSSANFSEDLYSEHEEDHQSSTSNFDYPSIIENVLDPILEVPQDPVVAGLGENLPLGTAILESPLETARPSEDRLLENVSNTISSEGRGEEAVVNESDLHLPSADACRASDSEDRAPSAVPVDSSCVTSEEVQPPPDVADLLSYGGEAAALSEAEAVQASEAEAALLVEHSGPAATLILNHSEPEAAPALDLPEPEAAPALNHLEPEAAPTLDHPEPEAAPAFDHPEPEAAPALGRLDPEAAPALDRLEPEAAPTPDHLEPEVVLALDHPEPEATPALLDHPEPAAAHTDSVAAELAAVASPEAPTKSDGSVAVPETEAAGLGLAAAAAGTAAAVTAAVGAGAAKITAASKRPATKAPATKPRVGPAAKAPAASSKTAPKPATGTAAAPVVKKAAAPLSSAGRVTSSAKAKPSAEPTAARSGAAVPLAKAPPRAKAPSAAAKPLVADRKPLTNGDAAKSKAPTAAARPASAPSRTTAAAPAKPAAAPPRPAAVARKPPGTTTASSAAAKSKPAADPKPAKPAVSSTVASRPRPASAAVSSSSSAKPAVASKVSDRAKEITSKTVSKTSTTGVVKSNSAASASTKAASANKPAAIRKPPSTSSTAKTAVAKKANSSKPTSNGSCIKEEATSKTVVVSNGVSHSVG